MMKQMSPPAWSDKCTEETRKIEEILRTRFEKADAYRYNSASIRVRVIDPRFEGIPTEDRDAMVEPYLEQLPERTQADIMSLFTFAPSELLTHKSLRVQLLNTEFDDPSPSML